MPGDASLGYYDPDPGTLGFFLREERLKRGIRSQEKAAKWFGINQGTYSKWERNQHSPGEENWERIAEFLHWPLEDLRSFILGIRTSTTLADMIERQTKFAEEQEAQGEKLKTLAEQQGAMEAHLRAVQSILDGLTRRFGPPDFSSDEKTDS